MILWRRLTIKVKGALIAFNGISDLNFSVIKILSLISTLDLVSYRTSQYRASLIFSYLALYSNWLTCASPDAYYL
jgi:uncharacterized membrane protein